MPMRLDDGWNQIQFNWHESEIKDIKIILPIKIKES
jgi:hypothetical protein